MSASDDKWILRGLDEDDPKRIKSPNELLEVINKIGFLPLFRNSVIGFSVEERTLASDWWTDDPKRDPWFWRTIIASSGEVAYGKFFLGCAGFVSKEWFPYFACLRRDGYDFDSRMDEGLAPRREIMIMKLFQRDEKLLSSDIKQKAGFNKEFPGFETGMASLQKMSYLTVCDFICRINKSGLPYGWQVSVYTTHEALWGYDFVTSAYPFGTDACKTRILDFLISQYGESCAEDLRRLI